MRIKRAWGSHLAVLLHLLEKTEGPVIELGGGMFSTPFLHWACLDAGRRLVTYEGQEGWYNKIKTFQRKHHDVRFVENWDAIDLSGNWGFAFVDHEPAPRRHKEVARLTHVDYVALHDAGGRDGVQYGYEKIEHLFKFAYMYRKARPMTAIVSNRFDPAELFE